MWIGGVRLDGHCHHVTNNQSRSHAFWIMSSAKAMHMCKDAEWNCGLNYQPEEDLLAHIKKNTVGIVLTKLPRVDLS